MKKTLPLLLVFAALVWTTPARAQTNEDVLAAVDQVAPTVEEVAQKLWDLAEVSLLETRSAAYLKDLLKQNGFAITSEDRGEGPGIDLLLQLEAQELSANPKRSPDLLGKEPLEAVNVGDPLAADAEKCGEVV